MLDIMKAVHNPDYEGLSLNREVKKLPEFGYWEEISFASKYKCSECGHIIDGNLKKYCPNCNRKMWDVTEETSKLVKTEVEGLYLNFEKD